MMVDDIRPETNIEWLWTLDLVELSWEVLRYQHIKKRILDVHRVAAIETVLQRLTAGMPVEPCQWSAHDLGGPPQNGATIEWLRRKLKRD